MTIRSKFLALSAVAALAGCAFLEELTQPLPSPSPTPEARESAAVPAEVPVPGRKPTPPLQAALPAPTSLPAAVPAFDPVRQEWTPEQTTAMLGEPTYRSERGSAIVWSYVRPGCELDLVFFMNVQTKVSRVLEYDLRASDGSDRSRQRCVEQLALERRTRDSGSSSRPR
jgi:hypothetical protein